MRQRLTNVEKYAIQGMVAEDENIEIKDIADKIKKPEKLIESYLHKLLLSWKKIADNKPSVDASEIKEDKTRDVVSEAGFINKTLEKKSQHVAIMTEQASIKSDENKQNRKTSGKPYSRGAKEAIYHPKPVDE